MDEAAANRLADAIKPFEAQPGFSTAQVWMRDRMNRLAQQAPVESSAFGSKARSRLVLSMYNIRAAAFFRLITNIETQNNFLALLDELPHVAWLEFTGIGTPSEIRDGAPSIDEGLARRKRWWIRRGYARLATLAATSRNSEIQSDGLKIDDDATAIGRVEARRQSRAAESDAASFEPAGSSAAPKVVGDHPAPPREPAVPGHVQTQRREKKVSRRNQKYEVIDKALQEIAESWPRTQEEILKSLDGRRVVTPPAEPFVTARGWMLGFKRDASAARAWLSKRWAELNLPSLPRGPKK